jgi:ligand-binding sensor domain-containing protein
MILKNANINKWFNFSLILLFLVSVGYSQNIKFKRLSIDEGLSAVTVNTIFQDSQDFIWIGTQDGLNRYDGYHFKIFKNNLADKTSISSNDVKCAYEDKQGVMYFGSNGGGLSIYNKYTESFVNLKAGLGQSSLSSNVVRDIIEINDAELLISTSNAINIYNKDTKKFKHISYSDSEISFTNFFEDSEGGLWVGSEANYIFEYDVQKAKLINYIVPESFSSPDNNINNARKNIYDITQHKNNLIFGSDGGLLFFDLHTKMYTNIFSLGKENRYNNRVKCFVSTTDTNKIMYGTWGGLVK